MWLGRKDMSVAKTRLCSRDTSYDDVYNLYYTLFQAITQNAWAPCTDTILPQGDVRVSDPLRIPEK
jgi:hypothetical protein